MPVVRDALRSLAVTLFHLVMAKPWFPRVFRARFQDSQIIEKGFDFFPNHGKLLAFLSQDSSSCSHAGIASGCSHRIIN